MYKCLIQLLLTECFQSARCAWGRQWRTAQRTFPFNFWNHCGTFRDSVFHSQHENDYHDPLKCVFQFVLKSYEFFRLALIKVEVFPDWLWVSTWLMFCWIIPKKLHHFHTSNMAPCVYITLCLNWISVWDAECFASNVWLLFPQECWYLTHPHYQLDRFDWQRHPQ